MCFFFYKYLIRTLQIKFAGQGIYIYIMMQKIKIYSQIRSEKKKKFFS